MESATLSAILKETRGTELQQRGEVPAHMVKHLDWNIYAAYIEHCAAQPEWSGPSRLCTEQRRRVKNRHHAQEARDRRASEHQRTVTALRDKTRECIELRQQVDSLRSAVVRQQVELAQLRSTQRHDAVAPDAMSMDGLSPAEGYHPLVLWTEELNGM